MTCRSGVNAGTPLRVEGSIEGGSTMRFCTFARCPASVAAIDSRCTRKGIAWLAALMLAVLPLPARAQDDDLPARVGRIAEFAGQLFLSPQDRPTEWEAIGINYPITSGGNLWVSGDGRAEVDYGGGQFRLAGDTSVHVSRLDDRQLALFIARGRLIVRVRSLDPGDVSRVDTPNTQVTLTRPGLYRIDVAPDREVTTLTVREGEAQVALANGAQQSLPGQSVTVVGINAANADIRNSIGADGFDTWSANRDRRYERGRSTAYVSREMVGYADLDEHGSWQTYPEYGAVWFPTTVAPGWAPYSDGYWTDVGGWGRTWVDRAPWGYAPFHYGRWAWVGGRWGWCPGAYVARPVWAPALVAWVGGPGWGLSVRHGAPVYGWVPLGWGDVYHPHWRRCSHNCWAHYNRPYAVNVTVRPAAPPARYANAGVPGAVSAVAAPVLAGRNPVATNRVDVPPSLAASAPVMASTPPVALEPRAASRTGTGNANPPPGASAHLRAPRPEPLGPDRVSRPVPPIPGAAPGTPAGGAALSGTPLPSAPVARPGQGPAPSTSPSGAPTARARGEGAAPKTAAAGTAAQPGLAAQPAQVQAPLASPPGASGALAPAPRESPPSRPPQPQRPRDPNAPLTAPQTAPGMAQVPTQSNETGRPARREPPRSRDPPAALQPVPAGTAPSPPVASRPVPTVAPPVRGAPASSPGLAGTAGVSAPAAPTAAAIPPPHTAGPAPAVPGNARGGKPVQKSVPDALPTGTGAAK
jgi:hypothetical protein